MADRNVATLRTEPTGHPPGLVARTAPQGRVTVALSGDWYVERHPPTDADAVRQLDATGATELECVGTGLGHWDTSLVAVVARLSAQAARRGLPVRYGSSLPQGLINLVNLALAVPPRADARREGQTVSMLAYVGGAVASLPAKTLDVTTFIGDISLSFVRLLRGKSACSPSNIWTCIQETGVGALPIVALISMLVGLILAFVGVVQLRMFGAEIYVSSLVAIGMTRIMGAIMTGIVLAGRTGASYAAIIGSMQVNEEVDALVSLGIPPEDYLVLPRIIALATMTPLLVLYADFMGIMGGFLVGSLILDINALEYLTFTQKYLTFGHLSVGLTHGFVFGLVVAITGCYQGLRCKRSAEGVGAATTAAVVTSIVHIILATAVLTLLFNMVGI